MRIEEVLAELEKKYPNKVIKKLPEENPSEVICEIDPTENHPQYSTAIAIIDQSVPHCHKETTEVYEVLRGDLEVFTNGERHLLHEGHTITIRPGQIHFARGKETWVRVYATPGWKAKDHILLHTTMD